MKRLHVSCLKFKSELVLETVEIKNDLFPGKKIAIYDLEIYPNYFLAMFLINTDAGYKWVSFTQNDLELLRATLNQNDLMLVGFNSLFFDDLIIKYIIYNPTCGMDDIYNLSNSIIEMSNDRPQWYWDIWKLNQTWGRSIDMMKIPNRQGGLKERGAACKLDTIKDLPIAPGTTLTNQEMMDTYAYCKNDLLTTLHFYNNAQEHLETRLKLETLYPGVDVISEHDPGVGEKIMTHLYCERNNTKKWKLKQQIDPPGKYIEIKDCIPAWVKFESDALNEVLSHYNSLAGSFATDAETAKLKHSFSYAGIDIKMGAGGLHTEDTPLISEQTSGSGMVEIDASGYYTGLIRVLGIRPSHMNESFNDILNGLVAERLEAKRAGDKIKDKGLKIITLSIFGKSKDKFSIMFDEKTQLSITLAGQFSILMLIETLRINEFQVLSANTDGVLVRVPKSDHESFKKVYGQWEAITSQELEELYYSKYIRRDVNNYMAIDLKGDIIKCKGVFKEERKGQASIISESVREYFAAGVNVEGTIRACEDIKKFSFYFHAMRGWELKHIINAQVFPAQKTCRWYVSKGVDLRKGEGFYPSGSVGQMIKCGTMTDNEIERYRATHGTERHPDNWIKSEKLQNGNNSVLINNLPKKFPGDIDHDYYVKAAMDIINEIEIKKPVLKLRRFSK